MCGIVGKIAFDGPSVPTGWLSHACELLAHRGPDRQQTWHFRDRIALGHRRLRIIDLDPSADQPMHNTGCVAARRASPLTIVFNGEIYNYRSLRQELLDRGHLLETRSDTEVILHLYEEYGPGCVERLRGMFAFAIWDSDRQQLFCARDRVGKKPLYWRHCGSRFWFASEPRAILADPEVTVQVNPTAIDTYLRLGFVPSPHSAFSGLNRLPPAHWALISAAGIQVRRYWSLTYEPQLNFPETELLARLEALLQESVRLRLLSDVPLGALLSGGVDSSAVVAFMARETTVRTFSIGFEDSTYDELPFAREVARHLGTDHHELIVRPQVADLLPKLAWHLGEPFADSSAVPTYYVAQLARRHVTVALNGDGGDESFGGYRRYRGYAARARYAALPTGVRAIVEGAARALPRARLARSRLYDLQRFLDTGSSTGASAYASWFGFFDDPASVLSGDFQRSVVADDGLSALREVFEANRSLPPAVAAMAADVALYLPDDLLVKADITAMAHGLEGRSPLLDHRLMEFAARLPLSMKIRRRAGKHLLRKLVRPLLPLGAVDRQKRGFGAPLDRWLRQDLAPLVEDVLFSSHAAARGLFDPRAVRRLVDEHVQGRRSHAHRIWALMMLELWHREYVDTSVRDARSAVSE